MRILLCSSFAIMLTIAVPSGAQQDASVADVKVGDRSKERWNWDVVVKAMAAAGAGAAWTYQWRGRHRGKLKADLEILEAYTKIDPDSDYSKNLRARIDRRMGRLYPALQLPRRDIDWSDLTIGLFGLASAVALLFFAAGREAANQEWYYVAAASLGLAGGAGIYKGIERKLDQP